KDSYITIFAYIGRAVHRSNSAKWQVVVHQSKDTFLHFTTVPCTTNYLHATGKIEQSKVLRVQTLFFPVGIHDLRTVQCYEIRFAVVIKFEMRRTDKHIGHKMCLPSYFHDKTYF